jgi:hypothetical protein
VSLQWISIGRLRLELLQKRQILAPSIGGLVAIAIVGDVDKQLRNEVWRSAMLGMLGGAVAAVTLIEALSRACL